MRIIILFLFLFTLSNYSIAQNFLPNGSFELSSNPNYIDPANSFPFVEYWYAGAYYPHDSTLKGTPDIFNVNHPWALSEPRNFWNAAVGAFDGDYHTGIGNHVNLTGYFSPEMMVSPLIESLETGEFYHIELQARNKGATGYSGNPPLFCVVDEDKRIDILLHTDSLFVTFDIHDKTSFTNESKKISLRSTFLNSQFVGGWDNLGTCFQADLNQAFLAITTPSGNFEVNPPCEIYDEHWDVFYVYYYDIDDVKLTKLQDVYHVSQQICKDENTKINITDLVDLPIMQNEIEYHWDDGTVDTVNYFSEAGTHHIDAIVDCKTISIELEITDRRCEPQVFVPNAFTPNNDGENDFLETFIVIDVPILEYEFSVYSRRGRLLFTTNDINTQWDGTYRGQKLSPEVYVWTLSYTIDHFEKGITNYQEGGDVMIVR